MIVFGPFANVVYMGNASPISGWPITCFSDLIWLPAFHISYFPKCKLRSGLGNIHSVWKSQTSNVPYLVISHKGENDHTILLTLRTLKKIVEEKIRKYLKNPYLELIHFSYGNIHQLSSTRLRNVFNEVGLSYVWVNDGDFTSRNSRFDEMFTECNRFLSLM